MKKECILVVLITRKYHNARFKNVNFQHKFYENVAFEEQSVQLDLLKFELGGTDISKLN
jgi:hypothetical protein